MYCRNCGSEQNENAIACLNCGCDPKKGNKNCHSCGVETNSTQIVCVKCGVSLKAQTFNLDTSKLGNFDYSSLFKNKQLLLAALAFLGYFLPWVSFLGRSANGPKINELIENDGFMTFLLSFFPLIIAAQIACFFIPKIESYKKILAIVGGVFMCLIVYKFIADKGFVEIGLKMLSIGFYCSLIGAIGSAILSVKKNQ